ncbi:fungal-specific transcription factor domain-containing protein [Bisporella sp. PMI_857]|nr:fungal-specific transcription factor domain-containing protein [Bisporella sp. PMI_857]
MRANLPPPSQFPPRDERLAPINQPGDRSLSAAPKPKESTNLPPELSTRLFQKFFSYIHPIWPILYKPMYASLDYRRPGENMPAALVAAIYAIAACIDNKPQPFATNTIVQRFSEPQVFFEEAMQLLQEADGGTETRLANALQPSILNCQVLTILSLQQHGVAEYSRAAVLCGIASSMAIELRLHRPHPPGDAINGEVRSRLWWNLYILEKMLSCEMGRPVVLRSEEVDCPYPSASEADEFELMSVYVRDRGQSEQVRNTSVKLRTMSAFHTTIALSMIMERIAREIYGLSARNSLRKTPAEGETKRIKLWLALKEWSRSLEASQLRLDLSEDLTSVPATVCNCVIMWQGTILVHRPFIARWQTISSITESSTSPLEVCLQAANNICLILEKYFDRLPGLPCDMVFPIFTAASTLLYHSKQVQNNDSLETRRRLKLCIHWLSVLGKSWKTAGARHQLLADAFDLNSELHGRLNVAPTAPMQSPFGLPTPFSQNQDQKPNGSDGYLSPEDWSFLNEFGDPTDDFYALDTDLRGLLDGEFAKGNSRSL